MSTIDRLKAELPADWQPVTDQPAESWRGDPARTVSLRIGERRLFVSFRSRGGWSGGEYNGVRDDNWDDLRIEIRSQAAKLALSHASIGKPIPPVPDWARRHLQHQANERIYRLKGVESSLRAELDGVIAEREALSALVTP